MSYKTYITEALVVKAEDSNTADRSFLLFTREAGMLYASAKSVRKEESKHRYALQECSHAKVTLVRGKSGWRVTGAEPLRNFYTSAQTRETRSFLRNAILLLRRVMHGDTPHPEIFDDVISACEHGDEHDHRKLEAVLALRVLHTLGYVAPEASYGHLLHGTFPHRAVSTLSPELEMLCRKAKERALIESQL